MAKEILEKTKMKSNKRKHENKKAGRSIRSSEPKPSADGFKTTLTFNSKRTSPKSIKTVLPCKNKSESKDAVKKKEKKEKLPLTPTSESSSHTDINTSEDVVKKKRKKEKLSLTLTSESSSHTDINTSKDVVKKKRKKEKLSLTPTSESSSHTDINTSKDVGKKKEKKEKLPLIPTSEPSSRTDINTARPTKDSNGSYVLFVGNLPYGIKKEQLEEHFSKTEGVKKIRLITDKVTKEPRGFGYIEFTNMKSHKIGLRLHHTHINGRRINVEFTSIGGNVTRRRENLKQKNLRLEKMKREFPSTLAKGHHRF